MVENGQFQLQTVEGKLLTFDLETGDISDAEADAPDLIGVWQATPCGGRNSGRKLIFNSDYTFEITDFGVVTFQGTWRASRPTMIELVPTTSMRSRDPMPRSLDLRGNVLNEATPGNPIICTFSRPGTMLN
jgi:hypothetical protein